MESCFEGENVQFLDIFHVSHFSIARGQVTSIIGESGAGKSTFAKLLNKMNTLTNGTIQYDGRSLEEWDAVELRREVVMLSQSPLIVEGTIEDNLVLGCQLADKELPTRQAMESVLQWLEVKKSLETEVTTLSGGEKQRIALGRVALMTPQVYILDEPTSALDQGTEDEVMDAFIQRAKEQGQTVCIITHSKSLAERVSDQILHIAEGTITDGYHD
ncbi:MAG TPA: ABC transporter ATP-binding protein [Savagea sp.]